MRLSSIFRNRWMAVLWAAGIVWSAAEFADRAPHGGSADGNAVMTDATGADVNPEQMKQVAKMVEQLPQ